MTVRGDQCHLHHYHRHVPQPIQVRQLDGKSVYHRPHCRHDHLHQCVFTHHLTPSSSQSPRPRVRLRTWWSCWWSTTRRTSRWKPSLASRSSTSSGQLLQVNDGNSGGGNDIVVVFFAGHRFQTDDPKVERMMTLLNKWAAPWSTVVTCNTGFSGFSKARLLLSIFSLFGESSVTLCLVSTPGVGLSESWEACSGG